MEYPHVIPGLFRARPNRFIALVDPLPPFPGAGEGQPLVCHVKNTGRCRELLVPGAKVYLSCQNNPRRKTQYDLIAVEKGERLINMDSAAPNQVFGEWVARGGFSPAVTFFRREYPYGDSRFDYYLEKGGRPVLVELKGVTLEEGGVARFPDAPTQRGIKHLQGLARAVKQGVEAWACFVVQMEGISLFTPNWQTHYAFGEALLQARREGVHLLAVECRATPSTLDITGREIPISLDRPIPD